MRDGRLCYLDFGMMGEVDVSVRRGLIRATLHLVNREYASLADDFVTLGMLPQDADRAAVVPALTGVFAEALAGEHRIRLRRIHNFICSFSSDPTALFELCFWCVDTQLNDGNLPSLQPTPRPLSCSRQAA
jgi:hypothetical protein